MYPSLETPRLTLAPLRLEDAAQVQPRFAAWNVVQFLNPRVPWPYPSDGVRTFYEKTVLPAIERGDEWHWMLRLKTAPEQVIGSVSLLRGEWNRGFWLGQPYWGRGLMTEAVERATDFWFGDLGFERLRVMKAASNVASSRISARLGMRLVERREEEFRCGRLPAEVWEITRDEWQARRERS